MDAQGIQEFGGHWECLTLPHRAALASQPAHNPLDKAVRTGSRNRLGRAQRTLSPSASAFPEWPGSVGRDGGWVWEWEEVTEGVPFWGGYSVLERGQCHSTAGHSPATTGTGHGTELSLH